MYAGKVYGKGKPFAPDAMIANVGTDLPNHPVLLGEFTDKDGERYLMIVNNSQTVDARIDITFNDPDVRLSCWGWDGKQHGGGPSAVTGSRQVEGRTLVEHWMAPGQEAVYKVESSALDKAPIDME